MARAPSLPRTMLERLGHRCNRRREGRFTMARFSANKQQPAKLVWRITANAPLGEYVDPRQTIVSPSEPAKTKVDPRENGWLASSLELLGGVRVSEAPLDTLPGELIEEFMNSKR